MFVISSLLFSMLGSFLVVYLWSKKYVRFPLRFDFKVWKKFLKESYPVGISAIITFAYFKFDTILLSILRTNADVGIYNAAYKVLENISFFPAMFVGLVMPIMSRYIFHEPEKFRKIADDTFKVFLILTIPLVIGTIFLSKEHHKSNRRIRILGIGFCSAGAFFCNGIYFLRQFFY